MLAHNPSLHEAVFEPHTAAFMYNNHLCFFFFFTCLPPCLAFSARNLVTANRPNTTQRCAAKGCTARGHFDPQQALLHYNYCNLKLKLQLVKESWEKVHYECTL